MNRTEKKRNDDKDDLSADKSGWLSCRADDSSCRLDERFFVGVGL